MRSRRPPSHLWSILVIVAMLWSQAVYAFHGGCLPAPAAAAHATMAMSSHAQDPGAHRPHGGGCNDATARQQDPACAFHCATPASSTDATRIPPPPVVLPDATPLFKRLMRVHAIAVTPPRDYAPPRVRPHGPTGHPAPLLLI